MNQITPQTSQEFLGSDDVIKHEEVVYLDGYLFTNMAITLLW